MKIYTRTGDRGQTSLLNGTRVPKFHQRVEAYGTIDELNSSIGAAIAFLSKKREADIIKELSGIQNELFEIGSALSSPKPLSIEGLEKRITEFESIIDSQTAQMPILKNFILPGGGKAGSLIHVCRTIARRAERKVTALSESEEIDRSILVYLNRLSDLLFTMARFINFKGKQKETVWNKK